MIALAAAQSIQASADLTNKVACTVTGVETTSGVGAPGILGQALLTGSVAAVYTVPGGKSATVSHILLANTDTASHAVSMFVDGSGAQNRVAAFTIPAGGTATFDRDGWKVLDGTGGLLNAVSGASLPTLDGGNP